MKRSYDVIIVSAYGRGHWLASELCGQNVSVALVDISEKLGRWPPEDWEGPFGFYRSDQLTASQIERLVEDDEQTSVDQGTTILLPEGPVELKGSLAGFLAEKRGVSLATEDYLFRYAHLSEKQRDVRVHDLLSRPFEQTWLAHLAHQLAANVFVENAAAVRYGQPLPFYSPLFIRRATRKGFEEGLNWCQEKGVKVFDQASVQDLMLEGRSFTDMEIKSEWSGVIAGHNLVWLLSSEETGRLPQRVCSRLFPKGALSSTWSWVRYRLTLSKNHITEVLPKRFIFIENPFVPWAHANLAVLQRTVREGEFDVWIRIPTQQRFHRSYLETMAQQLIGSVSARLAGVEIRCSEMPQEYVYDEAELGPPRFPVYDSQSLAQLRCGLYNNVYFSGPEYWARLDWTGQMSNQKDLFERLTRLPGFLRRKDDIALHTP